MTLTKFWPYHHVIKTKSMNTRTIYLPLNVRYAKTSTSITTTSYRTSSVNTVFNLSVSDAKSSLLITSSWRKRSSGIKGIKRSKKPAISCHLRLFLPSESALSWIPMNQSWRSSTPRKLSPRIGSLARTKKGKFIKSIKSVARVSS